MIEVGGPAAGSKRIFVGPVERSHGLSEAVHDRRKDSAALDRRTEAVAVVTQMAANDIDLQLTDCRRSRKRRGWRSRRERPLVGGQRKRAMAIPAPRSRRWRSREGRVLFVAAARALRLAGARYVGWPSQRTPDIGCGRPRRQIRVIENVELISSRRRGAANAKSLKEDWQ